MYFVYILHSIATNRYYIGHTNDLNARVRRHNDGRVPSTRHSMPWKLVYTEAYRTKSDAMRREMEIKRYKGGIPFKKLVGLWNEMSIL